MCSSSVFARSFLTLVFLVGSTSAMANAPCETLPTAAIEKAMGGPTKVTYQEKLKTCVFRLKKPGTAMVSLMKETAPKAALDGLDKDARAFLQSRGERKNKRLKKKGEPLLKTPLIEDVAFKVGGEMARGFYAQSNASLQLRFAKSRWVIRVKVAPKTDQKAAVSIAKAWLSSSGS